MTRLTILAGTTSMAGGGCGAAAGAALGVGAAAEPAEVGGAVTTLLVTGAWKAGCGDGAGVAAVRPTPESLASTVRPEKELSPRRAVKVGGVLMGASSGMTASRGVSLIGAPKLRADPEPEAGTASRERLVALRSAGRGVLRSAARVGVRSVARERCAERSAEAPTAA
jgi:hypothetical protein